jgi:hypothetical protein
MTVPVYSNTIITVRFSSRSLQHPAVVIIVVILIQSTGVARLTGPAETSGLCLPSLLPPISSNLPTPGNTAATAGIANTTRMISHTGDAIAPAPVYDPHPTGLLPATSLCSPSVHRTLFYCGSSWNTKCASFFQAKGYSRFVVYDSRPRHLNYNEETRCSWDASSPELFLDTLQHQYGTYIRIDEVTVEFPKWNMEYHYSCSTDSPPQLGSGDVLMRGYFPRSWSERGLLHGRVVFSCCNTSWASVVQSASPLDCESASPPVSETEKLVGLHNTDRTLHSRTVRRIHRIMKHFK